MIISFDLKKQEYENKKAIIFACILNYYKDLKEKGVNIPYFIRAREKYNEIIKNNDDVNYYYNKIIESR